MDGLGSLSGFFSFKSIISFAKSFVLDKFLMFSSFLLLISLFVILTTGLLALYATTASQLQLFIPSFVAEVAATILPSNTANCLIAVLVVRFLKAIFLAKMSIAKGFLGSARFSRNPLAVK